MNLHSARAIYVFEIKRNWRNPLLTVASPVVSNSLYFIIFGSALGTSTTSIDGVSYGAFIVPGLVMLAALMNAIVNASTGIFTPKFSGTIYEVLSAPISVVEVVLGYVGAAATQSVGLGILVLATARLFVNFTIMHPLYMAAFLILTSVTFSLVGFILGILADRSLQKLYVVPTLIITPLTFLGGTFYSVRLLPPLWRKLTLLNPLFYLVSNLQWSFYGVSNVNLAIGVCVTLVFLLLCLATIRWLFLTGYKLTAS